MPSEPARLTREALDTQYDAYQNYCPDCGTEHKQFAKPHTWRQHIEREHPDTWKDLLTKIRAAGGHE